MIDGTRVSRGEIFDGPRIRAIRERIGKWVFTTRPVAGFIQDQAVKLCDVTDAGFNGLQITVESLDAEENLIRRTVSADDLHLPFLP